LKCTNGRLSPQVTAYRLFTTAQTQLIEPPCMGNRRYARQTYFNCQKTFSQTSMDGWSQHV